MRIEGYIYQQNSVKREPATLVTNSHYYTLYIDSIKKHRGLIADLQVPSRVGNTSRKIQLSNSLFETLDNDAIDQAFLNESNLPHKLESKWHIAIPVIFIGIAFVASLFVWGVPFAAKTIAYNLPESVSEKIAKGSFEAIDKLMLSPSKLPIENQKKIRNSFNRITEKYSQSQFHYKLYFRNMSGEPNAFALPDGSIVITDKLIEYADNNMDEIIAILLHEIGHVEKRHGLRLAIEASSITLIIAMLSGDLASSDDLLITLPTILSTTAFSRQHEEEADNFSFEFMQKAKIDPIHFAHIMEKITQTHEEESIENADNKKHIGKKTIKRRLEKVLSYVSSHPVTQNRVKRAEEKSRIFNAGK